jgi:glutamate synthase domain-containing protein 3
MNHYTQYINYHVGLLQKFKDSIQAEAAFLSTEQLTEEDAEFFNTLNELSQTSHYTETTSEKGQWLINRTVSAYSQFMPLLPRDLLWFFGGDCLHYMPDDEIAFYQALDELRFTAEDAGNHFDYVAAKSSLAKSH